MCGEFCPGNYTFYLSASGWAFLRLQALSNASADTIVTTTTACSGFLCASQQRSSPQLLQAGKQYLLEVRHVQWGTTAHVAVAVTSPSTVNRYEPSSTIATLQCGHETCGKTGCKADHAASAW